jgi:hypothetical protein
VLDPLAVATLLQRVRIEARDHPPTAVEHAARHMIYPGLLLTPVVDQPDQV